MVLEAKTQIFGQKMPEYAAVVACELWRTDDGYSVKVGQMMGQIHDLYLFSSCYLEVNTANTNPLRSMHSRKIT